MSFPPSICRLLNLCWLYGILVKCMELPVYMSCLRCHCIAGSAGNGLFSLRYAAEFFDCSNVLIVPFLLSAIAALSAHCVMECGWMDLCDCLLAACCWSGLQVLHCAAE